MAKLKLTPDPTFKIAVDIPVAGSASVPVEFTFKHRDRAAMLEWMNSINSRADDEVVAECVVAWELDDEFTPENIKRLCDNYIGAGVAIYNAYQAELRGARVKN